MSAAAAAEMFPEAAFRSHRRTGTGTGTGTGTPTGNTPTAGTTILRATGDVLIPEALARHVEFLSGLTELWPPEGVATGAGRVGPFGGAEVGLAVWLCLVLLLVIVACCCWW